MAASLSRAIGSSMRSACARSSVSTDFARASEVSTCWRLTAPTRQYSQRPRGFTPVPFVTEQLGGISHTTDLFSRLLKERIISLNGPVDDHMSSTVVASLLYLEADNPEKPIHLYINSPGGSVSAGLAIYDTMNYIQSEVSTICMGHAASMGSLLLAGGAPGKRFALPHSSIMVHQPSGGYFGQASDISIHAKEILRVRSQLNKIYKRHLTGKKQMTLDEIEKMMERDYFLSAEDALELGIIDEIMDRRVKSAAEGTSGEEKPPAA